MKILQVIESFAPQFGGPVNAVYNLSEYLSKSGHDVTIVTTDLGLDTKYISSMESKGVNVVYFHCKLNLFSFFYSPSIKKWLKENINDFDIVHMHNFRAYQNYLASYYAKKVKTPYILQARGSVLPFFQKTFLKKLFDYFWGYKILDDAKFVIALTNDELNQYQKMGVALDKISIVPNGIDILKYEGLNHVKGNFRAKYNIKESDKIILFLGRIHKIKGIDLLIKSFVKINNRKNVKLVLVGPDDGFQKSAEKLVKKNKIENEVIFTGPLYGKEKLEAFADADLFILPSIYEAFPNTVLEAMYCEIPIIVTEGCRIADNINGKVGLKVNFDVEDLKNAIDKILTNEKLRREFGKAGKNIIIRDYTLKKVAQDISDVYQNAIN